MTTTELDPTITADDVAAAHDATPAPFPDSETQDNIEELARGFIPVVPATPAQALANAKALTDRDVNVGVGMCLATVRGREFIIPALWPDAETAWENGAPQHGAGPDSIPRGAVIFWTNGRHGHVALSVGGGLCRTTDYRRSGFVDLAPIANLASWCGGRLAGWAETLNGVDVWPNAAAHADKPKPKPQPKPWTAKDKADLIRAALKRSRDNKAPKRRIEGLQEWLDHIEQRLKDQK